MKKKLIFIVLILTMITLSSFFLYYSFIQNPTETKKIFEYNLSSESNYAPYGSIEPLKIKYITDFVQKIPQEGLFNESQFEDTILKYNNEAWPQLNSDEDGIDIFLSLLPENYRSHFTLIHKSFSPQKGTPLSPRVILFGLDARILMTFNAGKDEKNTPMDGGTSIEVIQWNDQKKSWSFSELNFDRQNKLHIEKNPPKCIMCHAGTPKPVDFSNTNSYLDKLKPIFPQYPFWPGFYGSVNDVVGLKKPGTKDSIMLNLNDTLNQIKGLTFGDTEELFRLKKLLVENPKYTEVIKNELQIHLKNFEPFINSIKSRPRYRNLKTLKELYTNSNSVIPEFLQSAPFRRTFDKEYGHYLLRPNFYLSTLLSNYQAQFIAEQIRQTEFYKLIQYSFLARKYNCGPISVPGIDIKELDSSFDLLYPNQSSQEKQDLQYLLAYQYNVTLKAHEKNNQLPLHAWNLEGNEDIASYHYGNVFSDLNELVLWNLAKIAFSNISEKQSRSGAEDRHYELPYSQFLKNILDRSGGFVSRMSTENYKYAAQLQNYYDSHQRFKALPVSAYCENIFKPAAIKELQNLIPLKNKNQLPAQIYQLNPKLYKADDIFPNQTVGIQMVKQACESCHLSSGLSTNHHIKPFLNTDWMSTSYSHSLKEILKSTYHLNQNSSPLKHWMLSALSEKSLPIPYGNQMPYGRRGMSSLSLECEMLIIQKNFLSNSTLKFNELLNCPPDQSYSSNLECRCRKLILRKDKLYKEFYMKDK